MILSVDHFIISLRISSKPQAFVFIRKLYNCIYNFLLKKKNTWFFSSVGISSKIVISSLESNSLSLESNSFKIALNILFKCLTYSLTFMLLLIFGRKEGEGGMICHADHYLLSRRKMQLQQSY